MAITNGYCTLAELKAALRITDSVDDGLLERAIEGASRRIDGYCGRFFYTKNTTVDFYATNELRVIVNDISSTAGLVLTTDDDGDGTFETTWTLNTDYKVEPSDAALNGKSYTAISACGSKLFPGGFYPWRGLTYDTVRPRVRIAAIWGWATVPHDVREACLLLSMRGYARLNAPLGVVGFGEMAVSVRAVDPDVRDLLMPYRLLGFA